MKCFWGLCVVGHTFSRRTQPPGFQGDFSPLGFRFGAMRCNQYPPPLANPSFGPTTQKNPRGTFPVTQSINQAINHAGCRPKTGMISMRTNDCLMNNRQELIKPQLITLNPSALSVLVWPQLARKLFNFPLHMCAVPHSSPTLCVCQAA